jgi:rhodanese-related sulfurtransferase
MRISSSRLRANIDWRSPHFVALAIIVSAGFPAYFHFYLQSSMQASETVSPAADPFSITTATLADTSMPTLWVDARSAEAFAIDHIPGALPLTDEAWDDLLPSVLDAWQPGMKTVVYCDDSECRRSHVIAERLRNEVGIDNVFYLEGGWAAWKRQNG